MVKKTDEAVNDYPEDDPGEILAEQDMHSLYQVLIGVVSIL